MEVVTSISDNKKYLYIYDKNDPHNTRKRELFNYVANGLSQTKGISKEYAITDLDENGVEFTIDGKSFVLWNDLYTGSLIHNCSLELLKQLKPIVDKIVENGY